MAQPCGFERFKKDIFTVKKEKFTLQKGEKYSCVKLYLAQSII